jgi:hypothetical protein
VQTGSKPEMPFEEGTDAAEQVENGIGHDDWHRKPEKEPISITFAAVANCRSGRSVLDKGSEGPTPLNLWST